MIDYNKSVVDLGAADFNCTVSVKVSVITVVFNGIRYIEDCICSVLSQSFGNIEFIIVDGGSTDGTLDIINKYKHKISIVISEIDRGIADAFNKGIRAATGDVVHLLNSDDYYLNSNVISQVVEVFSKNQNSIVIFKTLITNPQRPDRLWSPFLRGLQREMTVPHPSTFIPLKIYRKHGLYDISLNIAMDYDLLLKLYSVGESFIIGDFCTTVMRTGGVSSANFGKAIAEVRDVQTRYLNNRIIYVNYIHQTVRYAQILGIRFLDKFGMGLYVSKIIRRRYWK